jgi:hypothetical protein
MRTLEILLTTRAVRPDGTTVTRRQPADESNLSGKELEAVVDEDLGAFNEYFQKNCDNSPLRPEETAILKTYLWWKTHLTHEADPA